MGSHGQNSRQFFRKEDHMQERITALEAEIEAAQEAINEASLLAATEQSTPAVRLKKARAILEQREMLKLARLELAEARKQARAEAEEAAFAERCGNREAICEAVDEIEKESAALDKALAKASKHYAALEDGVRAVLSYGDNAEGFDLKTFKTGHPLQAPYTFAIHCLSEHFEWGPSHHLEAWSKPYGRDEAKARAFADFRAARDDWRNPSDPEPEGPIEYEEVQPKEMNNVVL
jgi:hypothetical protein